MLRARLTSDMKEAMKAGDKAKLATVRMIQAALKDKDIEARGLGKEPATEEEILGATAENDQTAQRIRWRL